MSKNKDEEKNLEVINIKLSEIKLKREQLDKEEKELKAYLFRAEREKVIKYKPKDSGIREVKIKEKNLKIVKRYNTDWVQFTDDNGQVIEQVPKGNKTKKELFNKLKTDGTLFKGIKKVRLVNVTEYIDDDVTLKKLDNKDKFQMIYSVNYNGKEVTARSTQFNKSNANLDFANKHAYNNLLRKLSYVANGVSDSDIGEKLLKDNNLKISKRAVYYKKY